MPGQSVINFQQVFCKEALAKGLSSGQETLEQRQGWVVKIQRSRETSEDEDIDTLLRLSEDGRLLESRCVVKDF